MIEKPFGHDLASAAGAQPDRRRGLPQRLGVPDRPLPGQGDRPEHPGAALRQRDVRADLELQLRRPRADHHGRGRRHRRPGRLLRRHRRRPRRHPEPPAPAARPDRHGGAGLLRRGRRADRRRRRCSPRSGSRPTCRRATARGQYADGWQGGVPVTGYLEEDGIPAGVDHRDLRGAAAGHRHPALGRGAVLPAHRQAAGPPGHRGRDRVQAGAAPAVRGDRHRGAGPERAGDPGPAGRGHHAALRLEGAGHAHGGARRHDGLRVRRVVHRVQPGGLRAAASWTCCIGEAPLFPRHEEVELSWRILDPVEDHWAAQGQPEQYPAGTWGPASADAMLARDGRTWRRP